MSRAGKYVLLCFIVPLFILIAFSRNTAASLNQEKKSSSWHFYSTPEAAGWSSSELETARQYFDSLQSAAVFVVYKGKVLISWGSIKANYWTHSARKSFMSAIYGIHTHEGKLDLQKTMAELNIDDIPSLSDLEKTARVFQLLQARSGVYHTAAAESESMHAYKPPRNSHLPGTFWCYNNWDFNTLVSIFNQETGYDFFEVLQSRIAIPLEMEDFNMEGTFYQYQYDRSIHPAYHFRLSARDAARFGLLYLQRGKWEDQQIVPWSWIKKSTATVSKASDYIPGTGYGYMWWTFAPGSEMVREHDSIGTHRFYAALGTGVQAIIVIPKADLVLAHRVDTDNRKHVTLDSILNLADMILAAKEFETIDLVNLRTRFSSGRISAGSRITLWSKVKNSGREYSHPAEVAFYLSRNKKLDENDHLFGTAALPAIPAGKKRLIRLQTNIPSGVMPMHYYIISNLDEVNANKDPDRTNNIKASIKKISLLKN